MKKIFLLLAVVSSFSVFAFKDGDFVFPKIKNTKSVSLNYDEELGYIFYKGRILTCPNCHFGGYWLSCEVDNLTDTVTLTCSLSCMGDDNFSITLTEAELDDYAWNVADDMSGSPFHSNDTVSPDAEYHGTKNIGGNSGSNSGSGDNPSGDDPSPGDNPSGGDDPSEGSLIPSLFSIENLQLLAIFSFGAIVGFSVGGYVVFLVVRRSLKNMSMIDK